MRHDKLYRECRECCCADGECREAATDRLYNVIGICSAVLLILLIAFGEQVQIYLQAIGLCCING